MNGFGMAVISLFGENDAKDIALMYTKLFLEFEGHDFGFPATSLIQALVDLDSQQVSKYIEGVGETSGTPDKART